MNARQIKALAWVGALGLGGWLGWTIYEFVEERQVLQQGVSEEAQVAVLNDVVAPPPPKDDSVPYELVRQAFDEMNWPGTPPAVVLDEPTTEVDLGPKYKPVGELLQVQYLQVDRGGDRSLAWVKFLDPDLVAAAPKAEDKILSIGDTLAKPWDGVTVKEITPAGVTFSFAPVGDDIREDELVEASVFERTSSIVLVDPDGVIEPTGDDKIGTTQPDWNPKQTTEVRKNDFRIGTETARDIDANYTEILTRDVAYQAYRDPSTRKITGIEITKVKAGSIPAQHGLSEGEVLKSINGHTVTSVSDAVAYVKKNADTTDVWVAVFEKRGREFTRTYRSPPE